MAEELTLTTPETKPSNSKYDIVHIMEDWVAATITITLRGVNAEARVCKYGPSGLTKSDGTVNGAAPTGQSLLIAQNKANFSVTSRRKAIYNRLITDGELVGTVTGVPD